jgi:hypothetical protein
MGDLPRIDEIQQRMQYVVGEPIDGILIVGANGIIGGSNLRQCDSGHGVCSDAKQ